MYFIPWVITMIFVLGVMWASTQSWFPPGWLAWPESHSSARPFLGVEHTRTMPVETGT